MDPQIVVNLDDIRWNVTQIQKLLKVPLMAVIKANAYGHGLLETAWFLEEEGIEWLMVGKLEEALFLRERGVRSSILNFGSFSRADTEVIVRNKISQSVSTEEAAYLHETALRQGRKAAVHLDIDTGMGRTGVPFGEALPLLVKISSLSGLKIEGIATTLTEDPDFDREQLRRFREVCAKAEEKGIAVGIRHAASSAGILADPEFHLDMVRPGIMVYGYYPSRETQQEGRLNLRPSLRLTAKIVGLRELPPGDTLSYHRVFTASRKMRVATVGIGYSDGYPPSLAGKGSVLIKGKKFPVIAAVTSNHLMVDLEYDPAPKIGDEVVLIDNKRELGLTVDVLEEKSGISVYKLLIGLNPLLPRNYQRA